jgi:hypothetical protein
MNFEIIFQKHKILDKLAEQAGEPQRSWGEATSSTQFPNFKKRSILFRTLHIPNL